MHFFSESNLCHLLHYSITDMFSQRSFHLYWPSSHTRYWIVTVSAYKEIFTVQNNSLLLN